MILFVVLTFLFCSLFGFVAKILIMKPRSRAWFINVGGVYFLGLVAIQAITIGTDWFPILIAFFCGVAISTMMYNRRVI